MIFESVALAALLIFFLGIRAQTAAGDVQFVKSMIPHHSGATLTCDRATITDAELKKLCGEIVQGQQQEIDQMQKNTRPAQRLESSVGTCSRAGIRSQGRLPSKERRNLRKFGRTNILM